MSSDPPSPSRSGGAAAWPAAEMLAEYRIAVPNEEQARLAAAALAERGHRWVRVRPVYLPHSDPRSRLFAEPQSSRPELQGWWHVSSLVDEQASDRKAEFHQRACEEMAVAEVARKHGGFADGGSMALRETKLRHLDNTGLIHELSMDRAHAARRAVIADFPPPREQICPSVPLQHSDDSDDSDGGSDGADGFPALLESVRLAVQDIRSRRGDLSEGTAWWLSADADGFEDDQELLFELADAAMHQDTCYPHTCQEVPLLADLAARDDVRPAHRAFLVAFLVEAATFGQRSAASSADRRVALGFTFGEGDDEQAARLAVEAAAPGLLARWKDECEAVRFALAALAAACPAAARHTGVIDGMRLFAESTSQPQRAAALRLAVHLAEDGSEDGDQALATGLGEAIESALVDFDRTPSPYAPVRGVGLHLLKLMLEEELSLLLKA